MQFFAVIAALAAVAAAAPSADPPTSDSSSGQQCQPATYSCLSNGNGWQVCNTGGQWVFAGNCPPKTHCYFNQQNQSPYCI